VTPGIGKLIARPGSNATGRNKNENQNKNIFSNCLAASIIVFGRGLEEGTTGSTRI
jgi:hypothetical protein